MQQAEELAVIWNYYKPRHTHAWNMLVFAFDELEQRQPIEPGFQIEYAWENIILRLWLYRTVVRTLTKLPPVSTDAVRVLQSFDKTFDHHGINGLRALRNMVEHFDDYAVNQGRGPASRMNDLDPWRTFTRDDYERGQFRLNREATLQAADRMRMASRQISDQFIAWYHAQ